MEQEEEFQMQDGKLIYVGCECDGSRIVIPEGIESCDEMFLGNKNLRFPPKIPEGVKSCKRMFAGSSIVRRAEFSSSVVEVDGIYDGCQFLEN